MFLVCIFAFGSVTRDTFKRIVEKSVYITNEKHVHLKSYPEQKLSLQSKLPGGAIGAALCLGPGQPKWLVSHYSQIWEAFYEDMSRKKRMTSQQPRHIKFVYVNPNPTCDLESKSLFSLQNEQLSSLWPKKGTEKLDQIKSISRKFVHFHQLLQCPSCHVLPYSSLLLLLGGEYAPPILAMSLFSLPLLPEASIFFFFLATVELLPLREGTMYHPREVHTIANDLPNKVNSNKIMIIAKGT